MSTGGPLTLAQMLLPLWLLYVALYVLLIQPFWNPDTQAFFLFGRLLLPTILLAWSSYVIYVRSSSPLPRLWLPIREMKWEPILFSFACGMWLAFVPYASTSILHLAQTSGPLTAYGYWSLWSPLFWVANLSLLAGNYAEELYFRALMYPYLRATLGTTAAVLVMTAIFTAAHLPPHVGLALAIAGLSLFSSFLVQQYDTLFYAFVAHSVMNFAAFLSATSQLHSGFYSSPERTWMYIALTSAALVVSGSFVWRDQRRTLA